jgi:hypothetical protein
VRTQRFSLGAEELIELGNGRKGVNLDRRPFLAGRAPKSVRLELGVARLGQADILDMLSEAAPYIGNRLDMALSALSEILDTPLGVLVQNTNIVGDKVSGLLKRIPSLKNLLSQVLVLGGALKKHGLAAPGMLMAGMGNMLAGIGRELKANLGPALLQATLNEAKSAIVQQAPATLQEAVSTVMNASGVTGDDPAPGVDLPSGRVIPGI